MLQEKLLHYVWKNGLFSGKTFRIREGVELEILLPGEENPHAGPDFFNARLRLGRLIWAGNVEIHRSASDWNKHGHHLDPAYDNVILHVIQYEDAIIRNSQGRLIHAFVVEPTDSLLERVRELRKKERWIPCCNYVGMVPEHVLKPWLHTLYSERLELKTAYLSTLLERCGGDRERALYLAMAAGFGLPVNNLPFEILAAGVPFPLLLEIKGNLNNLEALLFGHSGLLHLAENEDLYIHSLRQRYNLLKKEIPVKQMSAYLWKFLRIRPAAFPTIRLSQFASLIHSHFPMEADSLRTKSISDIERSLKVSASAYWNTHYTFGKSAPFSVKRLGQLGISQMLINVILPYIHLLHRLECKNRSPSPVQDIIHKLNAELNYITKNWSKFGLNPGNAAESQAMIQLYTGYCLKKGCSECQIGRELFRTNGHEV